MQREKRHERDGCGAIRVGNDPLMEPRIGGIDFRNHQRHRVVHPKRAGVVDDDAACFGREGRKLFRDAAAGAEQSDVNSLERVLRQFVDGDFLIAKLEFPAHGTGRRQQREFAHGKISFPKRFDQLDADGARRADHGNTWIRVH